MTGHISDRVLDRLLEGSLGEDEELAIEEHARKCVRCATRLREWQILFPQIKSLIPTSEHPSFSDHPLFTTDAPAHDAPEFVPSPRQSSLNVFVPDWSPPPAQRSAPARIAWVVVGVLALGAAYLLIRRFKAPENEFAFQPTATDSSSPASDTPGLGSGVAIPDDSSAVRQAHDEFLRDSIAEVLAARLHPTITDSEPVSTRNPAIQAAPRTTTTAAASDPTPVANPPREDPPRFPFRAENRQATGGSGTPATEPAPSNPPAPAPSMALPEQFTRVSLGEAISRLAGTVRLIQGMTPEAVEIAQGTILPGADPRLAVVRVVYNGPEGRIILDQQRLDRGQGEEPNIAISTAANGVSVAQWVDRGGFWISLAGKADQQALLLIANRIR